MQSDPRQTGTLLSGRPGLSRRQLLRIALTGAAATALSACRPIDARAPESPPGRFQTGEVVIALRNAALLAEPGSSQVFTSVRPRLGLLILGGPVRTAGNTFWRVGAVGADAEHVTGWLPESDGQGTLLVPPTPLNGTGIPDVGKHRYLGWPFEGDFPVSSLFGEYAELYGQYTYDGVPLLGHPGTDFALPVGTAVLAVDDGAVLRTGTDDPMFGIYVLVKHGWGESLYAHLDSISVEAGYPVRRGQPIALSGSSGMAVFPHLHFGLRVVPYDRQDGWGGYSDPLLYLPVADMSLPAGYLGTGVTPKAAVLPIMPVAGGPPYVVFDLCIRDGACAEVCPVECIVPGQPVEEWPWYYVDPDVCISCGACVPECPVGAIVPADEVPERYQDAVRLNALFFTDGPGYSALEFPELGF